MKNPIVASERVYLRALEVSDAEIRARLDAEETDTMMERARIPTSPIAYESMIADAYKQQPPENVHFAVCLRENDEFIGVVDLMDIDWINRTAETGSWMANPAYRGRGFGTEAKMLLLEYAFDHLHLHALNSYVWEPNARSAAALAKQGYRPAGRFYWEEIKNGVHRDALLFDILREDWLAAREQRR